MYFEKSVIHFKWKKNMSRNIWWTILFFNQIVNIFLALISCKIHVFEIFNKVDFFQIIVILRSTEILRASTSLISDN